MVTGKIRSFSLGYKKIYIIKLQSFAATHLDLLDTPHPPQKKKEKKNILESFKERKSPVTLLEADTGVALGLPAHSGTSAAWGWMEIWERRWQ